MVSDAASGRCLWVDAGLAALVGDEPAALLGRQVADGFDAGTATALRAAEQTALASPQPLRSEHVFEHRGVRHEFDVCRIVLTAGPAPGRRYLCSLWQDRAGERQQQAQLRKALGQIDEQQRANQALRRELAELTQRESASPGQSRAGFEDQLRREVDLSTREHREFALVYIEVDPAGDRLRAAGEPGQVLVAESLGRLLKSGTRAMDASCRYDERRFAVLLSGVGLATAHSRMEGLRRKCATQIVVHGGEEMGFTVSMGVASFPHTAQTQGALTDACEAALREAQRRGGNHVALAAIRFDAAG
jgi:diguanylate cyclase (GGDEF)-like protein